jgi:alpha-mannosidase
MDPTQVFDRAERCLRDRIYSAGLTGWHKLQIGMWAVDGEPVPFAQARGAEYREAGHGTAWGTPWSTTWFRITGEVPEEWLAEEVDLDIDLGWTWGPATGEALIHDALGNAIESIGPGRPRIPWRERRVDLYVEAAANPMPTFDWSPTDSSLGPMPDAAPRMRISRALLVRVDRAADDAANDMVLAIALAKELRDEVHRARALAAISGACDVVDDLGMSDDLRWSAFHEALAPLFDSVPAPDAPRLHAVANAHIDTAWLWPFREAVRKVARSFSNVLALMDEDPALHFASSQVLHLAWMAEQYPDLLARIRQRVGEGRWLIVGGTWVEPDGNMPSGESFARQFLLGQSWLADNLGVTADTFWLPDTFGYSAGLPQIARASGCDTFVTQKLSWNSVTEFPHTTLLWEGVDGSRLLTHFPPADAYNSVALPAELAKAQQKMARQPVADGLFLYGYGDGGGGPSRDMLRRLRQLNVAGMPRTGQSSVRAFFDAVSRGPRLPTWSGELYLEYHRGTLTSQSRIKQLHRRAEILLREAEIWATTAAVQQGADYPHETLRELWRELLVMQFHDVLPGTSIGWVHDEAVERLTEVVAGAEEVARSAVQAAAGDGGVALSATASPHGHPGVPALSAVPASDPPSWSVTATEHTNRITLADDNWEVHFVDGLASSFVDLRSGREVVTPGGAIGRVRIHPDRPIRWDAWDLDEQHLRGAVEIDADVAAVMPDDTVKVHRQWRGTVIDQSFRLRPEGLEITTAVDWHAQDCLLRIECDLDVLAGHTSAETMYGFVQRPTAANTSREQAKFETCGHRWVHAAEPGYGVTVLTPTTYGYQVTRRRREHGGVFTRLGFSLLRSAAFPDPRRDAGRHVFIHVIAPGTSISDAVRLADERSFPVRSLLGAAEVAPVAEVTGGSVAIEAVKLAEDGSGDVIVRIRETCGTRSQAAVRLCVPALATECDLLERAGRTVDPAALRLGPFEVRTLRFSR